MPAPDRRQLVLRLLAPITAQDQREIQSIVNSVGRSADDERRLFELVSRRGANYRFFFTYASGALWIPVLKGSGYFDDPPNVQVTEDGMVTAPPWWPIRYLSRVAKTAPEETLAVLETLPEFDNRLVHEDILDIALQLPGQRSARLLPQVIRYARNSGNNLPYRLPDLLVHWIEESQTEAALELARRMVYFAPDPQRADKESRRRRNPHDWTTMLRPSPRLESWHYQQVMQEGIRSLADAEPYRTAGILISAVDHLMRERLHEDRSTPPEIKMGPSSATPTYKGSWTKCWDPATPWCFVNADGDLTHDRRSGIDPPPLLSVTAGLELTRRSGYYWASPIWN